jgi:hypothetical protein
LAIAIFPLSDPELKVKLRTYRNQMQLEVGAAVEAADAEIRSEVLAE